MILKRCMMAGWLQMCRIALLLVVGSSWSQKNSASDLVTAIEQRYYMIMRLKRPIATLVEAHQKRTFVYVTQNAHLFKNPVMHRTFVAMERTQSATPFYTLWSYFLSYKFVEDKEFIKEMLTAILLLYKELILALRHDSLSDQQLIQSIDRRIALQGDTDYVPTLDELNKVCLQYKALCPTPDCHELNDALTSHHAIPALSSTPLSDSIEEQIGTVHNLLDQDDMDTISRDNTMRFYYIQRLLKSMFRLSRHKNLIPFVFDDAVINELACPSLGLCIKELVERKSVAPLFRVWSQITAYDFIQNTHYIREFVLVTCLVYKQMVVAMTPEPEVKAPTPKDVLMMYEKLATLPVAELLDLLDDVVEQYDTLAHHYALKDSSLTWKQWFEKYWWSAPIVVGSFISTLLKHAKLALFFQNNKELL